MRNSWRRFVCWWRGHTLRPKDGTYTGTIMHVLLNTHCARCAKSFNDIWNEAKP